MYSLLTGFHYYVLFYVVCAAVGAQYCAVSCSCVLSFYRIQCHNGCVPRGNVISVYGKSDRRHIRPHCRTRKWSDLTSDINSYRCTWRVTVHCGGLYIQRVRHKKTCHSIFIHNFDKCWPIFKIIISLFDSAINLPRNPCYISHHTYNVSLHHLVKNIPKIAKF